MITTALLTKDQLKSMKFDYRWLRIAHGYSHRNALLSAGMRNLDNTTFVEFFKNRSRYWNHIDRLKMKRGIK